MRIAAVCQIAVLVLADIRRRLNAASDVLTTVAKISDLGRYWPASR